MCAAPAGVGGAVELTLRTPSDEFVSPSPLKYTPPVISELRPSSVVAGGAVLITIKGSNFGAEADNPVVHLGGGVCSRTVWVSPQELLCHGANPLPPSRGLAPVTVAVGGQTSPPVNVAVESTSPPSPPLTTPACAVTTLLPSAVPAAGDVPITVVGFGFGAADSSPSVSISSLPCLKAAWLNDVSIRCVVPPEAAVGPAALVAISLARAGPCENSNNVSVAFAAAAQAEQPHLRELGYPQPAQQGGGHLLTVAYVVVLVFLLGAVAFGKLFLGRDRRVAVRSEGGSGKGVIGNVVTRLGGGGGVKGGGGGERWGEYDVVSSIEMEFGTELDNV